MALALYTQMMRGAYCFVCGVCEKDFLARSANRRYCSRTCNREGLARIRREWGRDNYVRRKMKPERIVELLQRLSVAPIARLPLSPLGIEHERRMTLYA